MSVLILFSASSSAVPGINSASAISLQGPWFTLSSFLYSFHLSDPQISAHGVLHRSGT